MTRTYVLMELPEAMYDFIKQQMLDANYGHAINAAGELDMYGIALVKGEPEEIMIIVDALPVDEDVQRLREFALRVRQSWLYGDFHSETFNERKQVHLLKELGIFQMSETQLIESLHSFQLNNIEEEEGIGK